MRIGGPSRRFEVCLYRWRGLYVRVNVNKWKWPKTQYIWVLRLYAGSMFRSRFRFELERKKVWYTWSPISTPRSREIEAAEWALIKAHR